MTMEQQATSPSNTPAASRPASRRLVYAFGIALALGVCLCSACAVSSVAFVAHFGGEPEGLSLQYDLPYSVRLCDEFDLVLSLTNSSDEPLHVSHIDLDELFSDSILDGAIVISTDPPIARNYSVPGTKSFNYDSVIPPGQTAILTFHLSAQTPGEFGGSIGVYVGDIAKRVYPGITILE